MHRNVAWVAGAAIALGGCSAFSRSSDAASAAGQDLTSERVAAVLTSAKGIPLNAQTAELVTNIWVDLTLFSQAVADNKLTIDSSLVAQSMWPALVEDEARRMKDSLVAHAGKVTDAQIDSAYKADKMRVVQHILIKVDATAKDSVKAAARKRIDAIADQLHRGASFAQLAKENSQDPVSAADSGMMPPVAKGFFVPEFDKVAWTLKPGDVSNVVTTEFGFHIIRRPTEAESHRLWKQALLQAQMPQKTVDSMFESYMQGIADKADIKVDRDATARMKAALADMDGKRDDHGTLTTYKGGTFTTGDFVRWVTAATSDPRQGPQTLESIKSAPDSMYPKFAKGLTGSVLLIKDAESRNIHISAGDFKAMTDSFTDAVDSLKATLGLNTLDPKASSSARSKAASKLVDAYLDSLVTNHAQLRLPPGMLAWVLRGHESVRVNGVGLKKAVDLALAKSPGDSLSRAPVGGAPPMPDGGMQPAPGGPPTPGGSGKSAPPPSTKGGGTPSPQKKP